MYLYLSISVYLYLYIYNIPNNKDIKAAREAYDKYPFKQLSRKVMITFLSVILTFK